MKKLLVMICALGLATTVACGEDDENNGNNATNNATTPTNNETNNETNAPTNNATNNETNAPTNNETNNQTNNETNAPTNNETNTPVFEPCADYCAAFEANCATDFGEDYTDTPGCLTACEGFTVGTEADTTGDTAGCRLYHAEAAAGGAIHCTHSGLVPDELCVAE